MNIKQLKELADNLYSKRSSLNSLWQEIADNFYPERAHFTLKRSVGTDFAAHLLSSYPIMCRRDLANQFSTMLRPSARKWFHTRIRYEDVKDNETKEYLEWFERVQRRAMYHPDSQFVRAAREGDHDIAAFGQCAISTELNKEGDGLLYRNWFLGDMAWVENSGGKIGSRFRKWKPSARILVDSFPKGSMHAQVLRTLEKNPFDEIEVMHMVVESSMFDEKTNYPWYHIWYDCSHEHVIEKTPSWNGYYVIPRWQTVSGSQYSYSPATVAALPDSRLLQAMTFTLLEAGEKANNPPIVATQDAVRSDVAIYAGGITWVDYEYDERTGEALRAITQDLRGFNYGLQMVQDVRLMIQKAFFLDTLTMPQRAPEMTAYEVGQRIQEYIRNALPLFEPLEIEYNAAICNNTFDIMRRSGGFGDQRTWPIKLQGSEIEFHFESPLHDVIEQQKATVYQQALGLLANAVALDPSLSAVPKAEVALRDALTAIGAPAEWMNSEADVAESRQRAQEQQQAQALLSQLQQGSEVVKNMGGVQQRAQPQPALI